GDVHSAAYVLARYARFQPRGTIHLAVVDPGVGSARRAITAEIDGQYYVTPDNGLLTRVLRDAASSRVVELDETGYHRAEVSATFHGRDIFAPRSEERRVGKECRSGWSANHLEKKAER